MTWVRLDDHFFLNRKTMEASKDAKLLFLASLCHCNAELTDGFVSSGAARSLAGLVGAPARVITELVDRGFWHKRADGFEVHDYLIYQPTAAQIRQEREATAKRVQRFRDHRRRNAVTPPVTHAVSPPVTNAVGTPGVTPAPTPTPISNQSPNGFDGTPAPSAPPAAAETEDLEPRKDPLVTRLVELVDGVDRPRIWGEATTVIVHLRRFVDDAVIDERIGYCATLAERPRSPRYLLSVVRTWAGERGIDVPAIGGS